jgi:hypothetical protein
MITPGAVVRLLGGSIVRSVALAWHALSLAESRERRDAALARLINWA